METVAEGAGTRSPGQVLAAERERQGLARTDVAQRLHMSPWQVEALEAAEYARLPKGTFLRGFVRNYARLLHVESDPLLALLPESAPSDKAAGNIVPPSEKIRFEPMGERAGPVLRAIFISLVVLGLGFAAMYWWFFMRDMPPAADARRSDPAAAAPAGAPQQVAAAPVPPAETPPPVEAPREEASPVEASVPAATNATSPPPPEPAAARPVAAASNGEPAASGPAAAAGERRLAFRFTGESWIEVKDASGRTLISQLNPAGTEAQVSGRAPFTVVVGNAPEVRMSLDDRPFDLQPHSRVGVARLTVQ